MKISKPIIKAEFLRRLNRFTAEVSVNGRKVTAHLPNPSRLLELFRPGATILLSPADKPWRKTPYSIFGVYDRSLLVGIDSRFPNSLFAEAIEAGSLSEFNGYHISKREVSFGDSRFDFLLERPGEKALVEVKSCSLVLNGVALFPDVPTERGLRHVLKLTDAVKEGLRAFVVWVVQRPDAKYLRPYIEVHREIEEALRTALNSGVNLVAYTAQLKDSEMSITGSIPVKVEVVAVARVEKAASFLHESLGLEFEVGRLYSNLLVRGSMSLDEIGATGQRTVGKLLQMGLAIVHPSEADKLMPVHPRLGVTNIVKMLGRNAPRADVDRAVALLSGLYRNSDRAGG